jgi:hypothetical protein
MSEKMLSSPYISTKVAGHNSRSFLAKSLLNTTGMKINIHLIFSVT